MYQMYPSHPYWKNGEKFLIEPQLGVLSGPMKITIEHGEAGRYGLSGLGNPEYLEPGLSGTGEEPGLLAIVAFPVVFVVGLILLGSTAKKRA